MGTVVDSAIRTIQNSRRTYCKFLSANDSGETGGHQCGILVSQSALKLLFRNPVKGIESRWVDIEWPNNLVTRSRFVFYESKHELRITNFGSHFPYLDASKTGSLFLLSEIDENNYKAFVIDGEENINYFLDFFGLTSIETNKLLQLSSDLHFDEMVRSFLTEAGNKFPDSEEMAVETGKLLKEINDEGDKQAITDPDKELVDSIDTEYRLFRAYESHFYGEKVGKGFASVDDFTDFSKSVLNRRKSRSGKSLEHHLCRIFAKNGLKFSSQPNSEENKIPDFLFPSEEAYKDSHFPEEKLIFLAAKTTCKDRWRQILNEANRTKTKFLCTLQQGITRNQMQEMREAEVVLVVPKPFITSYPIDFRKDIWTIKDFIDYVKLIENS